MSFLEMLRKTSKTEGVVKRYSIDLREFAELRNAITHSKRDDFVIAEPHAKVVEEIRRIKDMLYTPPLVLSLPLSRPYIATPEILLSEVLATFEKRNFMRCPVIIQGKVKALISAKTITHFLAKNSLHPLQLSDVRVSELLMFTSESDFEIVGMNNSLFEAYDVFKRHLRSGKTLQAAIVTDNGQANGRITGIITPSDLPRIFEILGP